MRHFSAEIQQSSSCQITTPMSRGQVAPKSKFLRPHNPFIGPDGLLCEGSRLIHAAIADEQKYPIILPPKHDVTISILCSCHCRLMHVGPKQVLDTMRRKYWVNRGLQTTKNVINRCIPCQRRFKLSLTQKMVPLAVFPSTRPPLSRNWPWISRAPSGGPITRSGSPSICVV